MNRVFASLICFLLTEAAGSHAAPSPELYWKSRLPNTVIPGSISQLLNTDAQTNHVPVVHRGDDKIRYGHDSTGHDGGIFVYNTNNDEVGPSLPLFFQEKDLRPGKKMTMHFTNIMAGSRFLPRNQADAIPFSSQKIPEILSRFGLRPDSMEAADITHTLHDCELPPVKGEKKACLSSLESLVDFAVSSLGTKNVKATTTVVSKDGSPEQEYTVTNARLMSGTGQLIACHAVPYVYAVFVCHRTQETSSYVASMVGKDGTAVEAVAVCHTNTADWNPKHVAFKVLNVKPGTVPVCHLMQPDSVTWTRSG